MFSIIYRHTIHDKDHRTDTAISDGYFFTEDKLISMRLVLFTKQGRTETRLYFQNDQLLLQKGPRFYSDQEVDSLKKKAYEFLEDGNLRIKQKFTGL